MFRILALQVDKSCKPHIRRCLLPDMMYYLCNDYDISKSLNGVWTVCKKGRNMESIDDDFFKIQIVCDISINISAVVGENGSGKSTIVDLILRIINNCSIKYDFKAENGKLEYVDGVYATLFYMKWDTIYCISMAGTIDSINVKAIAKIEKDEIRPIEIDLSTAELKQNFFYTLVSNYSHYAYNTKDYLDEWNNKTDEDSCWLKWLFHKNDGYQTPLTLHPFRDQGTIDIEREKDLSSQRLLYFFIDYTKKQKKRDGVFKYIKGKHPKYLNLRMVEETKLQEDTILYFLCNVRDVSLLDNQIEMVRDMQDVGRKLSPEQQTFFDLHIIQPLRELAYRVIGVPNPHNKKRKSGNNQFFVHMTNWLKEKNIEWFKENKTRFLSDDNDIRRLLRELELLYSKTEEKELKSKIQEVCDAFKGYDILNLCQIQRLELVNDICNFWNGYGKDKELLGDIEPFGLTPEIVTKRYEELSYAERGCHYIIYKTIDIFETYPSYQFPLWERRNVAIVFDTMIAGKHSRIALENALIQLMKDVNEEKTHITLKIRQTLNYLKNTIYDKQDDYVKDGIIIKDIKGVCLSAEKLALLFKDTDERDFEKLPPPIYERHLFFETEKGVLVDMETFSSGEKQLLNTQSAIIYHLQNLSSIFKDEERLKFPQVNIILEEIELYFHPDYQRAYINSLLDLIEHSGIDDNIHDVNLIMVTHSPFILSDIPKNNVLFLKDGRTVTEMQENTFGANIHSMLQNAFFLNGVTIGDFARNKINQLFGKLHDDVITEKVYKEILLVSEPFIKSQLLKMYNERYPHHQMKDLEKKIAKLEHLLAQVKDDKN